MSGRKKNLEFSGKHIPLMIYMPQTMIDEVKGFATHNNMSVSEAMRLGFKAIVKGDNPYLNGYKAGVDDCINLVEKFIVEIQSKQNGFEQDIRKLIND
tara:strand:- start:772 stop:1065 length:294 start_codon:yes stop_codon:yes gene_type:complete